MHTAFLLLTVVCGVSALSHAWGLCCVGLSEGCRALHLCLGPGWMLSHEPAGVVCVGIYALHLQQVLALHWLVLGGVDCVGLAALLSPSCICLRHSWGQGMPRASVSAGSAAGCRASYFCPPSGWCLVSVAAFEPHWDLRYSWGTVPQQRSPCNQRLQCVVLVLPAVSWALLRLRLGEMAITSTCLRQWGLRLHCSAPTKFNLGSGGNTR